MQLLAGSVIVTEYVPAVETVFVGPVPPPLQINVALAGLGVAVSVTLVALHVSVCGEMVTEGVGTVIVVEAVTEQPAVFEIVTVYVVVTVGLAVGFETLLELNPAEGDQL